MGYLFCLQLGRVVTKFSDDIISYIRKKLVNVALVKGCILCPSVFSELFIWS